MPRRQRLGHWLASALTRSWLRRGWLAWLLWPVSLIYGLLLKVKGLRPVGSADAPKLACRVVVIGNVVAGGSGKTPVVIALAQHLQARGVACAVISRGYGRRTKGCREVLSHDAASDVGDEPALVKHATALPVFVAAQRHEAARALLARYPLTEVILSDDGLQHTGLHRDLEVCVFDDRGIGNGFLLPAGPLREPWPRRADLIVHTGSQAAFPGMRAHRQLAGQAISASGQRVDLQSLCGTGVKPLLALAAIARPEQFFDMLRELSLPLTRTLALPDHYDFSSWKPNEYKGYQLICTEKDAMKLWRWEPDALAVPLLLTLEPAFIASFDTQIDRLLGASLSSSHGHKTT